MEDLTTTEAVEILGITGRVDAGSLKAAYRRQVLVHHPDHGGDAVAFARVQAAYERLRDALPGLAGAPPPQERVAAVEDRWWESSSRWYEGPVDTDAVDWSREPPAEGSFRVDRDLLAVLLARSGPVAPVTLVSRSPGSWSHRFIDWLQPDLLAELRIATARDRGIRGHDVAVDLAARSLKARRLLGDAGLPAGWVKQRGSASVTVQRVLHPAPGRRETAVRVAGLVAELLSAVGWPLEDWFVVGR